MHSGMCSACLNIVQQQPMTGFVKVTCSFLQLSDGRLQLSAFGFDSDLDQFFELRVPGFTSPRSTAQTAPILFTSFDSFGRIMDTQSKGLVITAKDSLYFSVINLTSSSPVVAEPNCTYTMEFTVPVTNFLTTDSIQIRMPKWNADSPSIKKPIMSKDSSPVCQGLRNARETISCVLQPGGARDDFDTLVLNNPFDFKVPRGELVRISFSPVLNPTSTHQQSGYTIFAKDQNGGSLAQGATTLTVTVAATIPETDVTVEIQEPEINHVTFLELQAKLPAPLEAGCKISIKVPRIIKLDQLVATTIHGMFGPERNATFAIISETNTIEISDACPRYLENIGYASIDLVNITNPGYVIDSLDFVITFVDRDQNLICQTGKGLSIQNTPGQVKMGTWTVTNPTVSNLSSIFFSIQPEDPTVSADVMIKITLPLRDFPMLPAECLITQTNQYISASAKCSTDASTITVIQALKEPFRSDGFINFAIDDILMPSSVRPTGTYVVEFYDKIDGQYRLVDRSEAKDMLRATSGELGKVKAISTTGQTYSEDVFDFVMLTSHSVLKGGFIEVTLPAEMQLLDTAACLSFQAPLAASSRCKFYPGERRFQVIDAFLDGPQADIQTPLQFQVSGILTPRQSKPVSGFKFSTLDSDGFSIDTYKSFVLDALSTARPVSHAILKSDQAEVGKMGNVTFTIKSPVPLFNGDILKLQGPMTGKGQDLAYTYKSCQGLIGLSKEIQCVLKGIDGLEILMELTSGESLPANTEFSFTISQVQNPQSTKPSGPFSLRVEDAQGYLITETSKDPEILKSFALVATQPSSFLYASVISESRVPKSQTILKFQVITQHELSASSNIKMHLPSLLQPKASAFSCWTSSNPDSNRKFNLTKNDDGSHELLILNVNQYLLIGGSTINFEIRGMINAATSAVSDSFTIQTQTSDGYLIDMQSSGLLVSALCNYPCMTCLDKQPNECRSCDQDPDATSQIFFNNRCIGECPKGYFVRDNLCPRCDGNCLECAGQSQQCTKCAPGRYLLGNTCLDVCPDEYYANDEQGKCLPCSTPCKTCLGKPDFCTSCDSRTPTFLLFESKCYEKCPADVSVFSEGKCLHCSSNCKTCLNKFDSCTTCSDGLYLNQNDLTCVETCAVGISVPSLTLPGENVRQSLTCESCDPTCLTCSPDNPGVCTACRDGLMLVESTKQCLSACPAKTAQVWIPLTQESVCAQCSDGCSECMNARDHCTACEPGFVFHQYSCLRECPADYRLEGSSCVLAKKICPYGYSLNATSDQCELMLAKCHRGFVLNGDLDKCIPEPGFHFPFAFIYASIAWTYIILRRSNRDKFSKELLATQLLIGLTFIQQVGCFTQLGLSLKLGFGLLIGFHMFSVIIQYLINFGCLVSYLQVIKDPVFDHWRHEDANDEDSFIIFALATVFSFKAIRLFYCQLFEKAYFKAATEDHFRTFSKPIWIMNMVGLVPSAATLIVNVYTIWLLKWGYEIKTLAFESIALCLVITGLEIYEYVKARGTQPKYMAAHEFVLTAKQEKRMAVMAEAADDEVPRNIASDISVLETVIRRLNETDKLAMLVHNIEEAEMKYENDPANEDEKRRMMLKNSSIHKQHQLREKRKQFEYFRSVKKQLEKAYEQIGDVDVSEIELRKEDERSQFQQIQEAAQLKSVLPEIDFNLLKLIDPEFKAATVSKKPSPHLSFADAASKLSESRQGREKSSTHRSDDRSAKSKPTVKSKTDKSRTDQSRTDKSRANKSHRSNADKSSQLKSSKAKSPIEDLRDLTALEKLQHLTQWELNDDNEQFEKAYKRFKGDFDYKARNGTLVPNMKLNQSFDEDVLREMYDDFGPESDFESELSWISYPPRHGFIREFWENNPRKMAEGVVFRDKIKYKYQFNNCAKEIYPVPEHIPKVVKPSRRTQTFGAQANSDFDPFASANEISDSQESEQLSVIDDRLLKICDAVIDQGFSSDSQETVRAKNEVHTARSKSHRSVTIVDQKVSRKRKRPERTAPMHIDETDTADDKADEGESDVRLGTVFDKEGKVLYDKDYMSHIDDAEPDQVSSKKSESDESEMEPAVEEETKQPGTPEEMSESEYSIYASIRKKKKQTPLERAYQPQFKMMAQFGVGSNRSSKSRRSGMSKKSSPDKETALRAQTAFSANVFSKKKSETDDQRFDDETRENNSSAVDTVDQNKHRQNPGYSLGGQWERGDISGDISADDSRPFELARTEKTKNGQDQDQSSQEKLKRNLYSGMPDIKRYQSQKAVNKDSDEEIYRKTDSFVTIRRPQPFTALGVDSKPYRANTRKRKKQMEQDQRRAMVTDAFSRINKLECIYLKTGLQKNKNMTPPPMPVTEEYLRVIQRHQNLRGTLKKQNFIEDGHKIVSAPRTIAYANFTDQAFLPARNSNPYLPEFRIRPDTAEARSANVLDMSRTSDAVSFQTAMKHAMSRPYEQQ